MKVPLSWLKEFVPLSLSPADLANLLTLAGLEVDAICALRPSFEGVVVGRVVEAVAHPQADRLRIASVTDGQATYQVVCAAPNCRQGIRVAFAKLGALLHDEAGKPFKIKKAVLRGVESHGMLCSAKELGIAQEDGGIIELSQEWEVGSDLSSFYTDTVFDLSLTPNLGHCASILGVAREVAALTKTPLIFSPDRKEAKSSTNSSIRVEDPQGCPLYCALRLQGVSVGPSPYAIAERLRRCGIRPINNVVDATNLVMLELGQPLHAFDLHRIKEQKIIVRKAHPNESLTTLDGQKRSLKEGTCVIADPHGPIALAGIMGGQESEVSSTTTDLLIESAYFDPLTIRRSAKQLGLSTEASRRFERGCDPQIVKCALQRAAQLIQTLAGGKSEEIIEVRNAPFSPRPISCRPKRVNELLGTQLSSSEIETLLRRLYFDVTSTAPDVLVVCPPSFRSDIKEEIDLIEEVGRLYGFSYIPAQPSRITTKPLPHHPLFLFESQMSQCLLGFGFQQLLSNSLISLEQALPFAPSHCEDSLVTIVNPSSVDHSTLRPSLLPSLLNTARHNVHRMVHNIAAFEIGQVHCYEEKKIVGRQVLGLLLTGTTPPLQWAEKSRLVDFFDLKGVVEQLLASLNVPSFEFRPLALPCFHPGRQAALFVKDIEVGVVAQAHPQLLKSFDLSGEIFLAELSLSHLLTLRQMGLTAQEPPLYPSSTRDWNLLVQEEVPMQKIFNTLEKISSPLLKKVALHDIYRSSSMGDGWKKLTLHFIYRDDTSTLSDQMVDKEHTRIVETVLQQMGEQAKRS